MTRPRTGWQAGVLCLLAAAAAMAGGARSQPPASRSRHPPQPPTAPAPDERVEVPPPPFTDGIFPCSSCHASMPVNRTRRELTEFHTGHRPEARRAASLVPRLPRCRPPRPAAPGERDAGALRRELRVVRPVPRREAARLARRRARPADGPVERPQDVPAVRALPQSAPAPVQGHPADARARAALAARPVTPHGVAP